MAAIDYKKERAMIFRYAEHLKGLKNELVQSVESLISVVREGPVQRIKEELNNLSPNIDSCIHGMQLEDQKCSLIEDRIADLLYRVSKIEGQMCPGLENHLHHVQPSEYPPRTDSATSQYQMVDDSIYPTPAIVEELYSRMGDYKNYMEELHNFEWELREALDERESLRANPNVNLVSDEEFFKEQKGLRAQLIENLDLAQADVTRLRQQCINDGIPFEDGLGFPIIPFNTGNESHAQTSTHTSAMGILPLDPANASPESIIGGFFDTQNRVADWIEDTPEGYHEPHPSSEGAVDKTGDLSDLDIISELSWEAPRLPSSPPDEDQFRIDL
ncbi:hypothetical protein GQ43DRAFT_469477 [Delitschia confertaspora ATCC 74209]|uniref:Uncharacterized protein n=1 Tax=Delitschia confertaspora ATCC 74209 TaxID=1513339 RepID=A0A9P4N1N9_9PLEO|nr:hypothetical protein GQ43DRAFT_469477 [Delitschia confertaspora ATCC 74209]